MRWLRALTCMPRNVLAGVRGAGDAAVGAGAQGAGSLPGRHDRPAPIGRRRHDRHRRRERTAGGSGRREFVVAFMHAFIHSCIHCVESRVALKSVGNEPTP